MDYNENVSIDLHIHSTASDGTLTPLEILAMALELELGAIAITDHDTISGSKELVSAGGIPDTIRLVPGVEISAAPILPFDTVSSYHILGYFIRFDDSALNQVLAKLQNARFDRNLKIISRLNNLGINISLEEIQRETADGQLGRPHIARALIREGVVASIDQAFDDYLGIGKPAYVDKFRISCQSAIDLISRAGGIPVLAHPGLLKVDRPESLGALFSTLKEMGLRGIEVYYPEHSADETSMLLSLALFHDLLVTGGSDFHGSIKPGIKMGSGNGTLFVPFGLYEKLAETATCQHDLSLLERKLGYRFQNRGLLEEALQHSSFVNEQVNSALRDNERFEFLGDAVLNLAAGHLLMQHDPDLSEGDLTKIRANMVNELQLASIARSMDLGRHLRLGKGEIQTGGYEKDSILADSLEAVIAAVYLDGGFQASFQLIEKHFSYLLDSLAETLLQQDYKSRLQELVQCLQKPSPQYRIVGESGPDHDKEFRVQLDVLDIQTSGGGRSKKAAEQDAARSALKILKPEENETS